MRALREKVFRGWPEKEEPLQLERISSTEKQQARHDEWMLTSHDEIRLPLRVLTPLGTEPVKRVLLVVADEQTQWADLEDPSSLNGLYRQGFAVVFFAARGIGPTVSRLNEADKIEVRRRYMLLGQTLGSMRVWDIQRATTALRSNQLFGNMPITLMSFYAQAIDTLYASLFIDGLAGMELIDPPISHVTGPDYLNILRFLDIPQALALAAERQPVKLSGTDPDKWSWTTQTAQRLGWPRDRLSW